MRRSCITFLVLALFACGSDGSGNGDEGGSSSSGGGDPNGNGSSSSGGTQSSGSPVAGDVAKDLVGVWTLSGKDARGAYHGQAEVRADGTFVRAIQYDGVKVEGGRDLHWAFIGKAKGDDAKEMSLDVTLENRGFITERENVKRTAADAPIAVKGTVKFDAAKGQATATYSGTNVSGEETWEKKTASGTNPIVVVDRTVVAAHDPPSALEKAGFDSTYGSYRELPAVKPYVNRAEFKAAIHGHIVDKTDYEFYRANPNALRVINKSVDAISLGEALSRANAYRKSLAEKAAGFDAEVETEFLDASTGMLLDGAPPGTPRDVHMSAALWTGIYAASQIYRWQVTGDAKVKANVLKTLDGILKLQEVTGNWKEFARAIRPKRANTALPWRPGAGALSNLEWMEGGNNDMMKGLYIAYALGHDALCKSNPTGVEANLCARIRVNSKHLADDINVDRGTDELDSTWLTAVVSNDMFTKVQYQGKAEGAWAIYKTPIEQNTQLYAQGTADWSGLNLGFVGNLFKTILAQSYDVGGNGKVTYTKVIEDSWSGLRKQRLPLWNLLQGAYGTTKDPAAIDDALWRLREMPFPKSEHVVDHRISPDFCMSPYPSLPWKNDWTTTDRTQALRSVPLFEDAHDIYRFRLEMKYSGDSRARAPAADYLIGYWFGRKFNLIKATD